MLSRPGPGDRPGRGRTAGAPVPCRAEPPGPGPPGPQQPVTPVTPDTGTPATCDTRHTRPQAPRHPRTPPKPAPAPILPTRAVFFARFGAGHGPVLGRSFGGLWAVVCPDRVRTKTRPCLRAHSGVWVLGRQEKQVPGPAIGGRVSCCVAVVILPQILGSKTSPLAATIKGPPVTSLRPPERALGPAQADGSRSRV